MPRLLFELKSKSRSKETLSFVKYEYLKHLKYENQFINDKSEDLLNVGLYTASGTAARGIRSKWLKSKKSVEQI